MHQMKYVLHRERTGEDGGVFIIILLSSASAQGHSLSSFWRIAYGVQRCVKTHKQHLRQWQPGTPSVPHSPSKSAHVASHLLRPSSLLLLLAVSTVVAFQKAHLSSGLLT